MQFCFWSLAAPDVGGFEAAGNHVSKLYGPKKEEEKGDRKRIRKRTRG